MYEYVLENSIVVVYTQDIENFLNTFSNTAQQRISLNSTSYGEIRRLSWSWPSSSYENWRTYYVEEVIRTRLKIPLDITLSSLSPISSYQRWTWHPFLIITAMHPIHSLITSHSLSQSFPPYLNSTLLLKYYSNCVPQSSLVLMCCLFQRQPANNITYRQKADKSVSFLSFLNQM